LLHDFFASVNFKPSAIDPCLFIHQNSANPCFVYVHVNDLVILGPSVQVLKDLISKRFEMEDLGDFRWVL
jgi:hypothetical protein